MRYLMVSKKKNYLCADGLENPSLVITVCHHWQDSWCQMVIFGPTLTFMINSYSTDFFAQFVLSYFLFLTSPTHASFALHVVVANYDCLNWFEFGSSSEIG